MRVIDGVRGPATAFFAPCLREIQNSLHAHARPRALAPLLPPAPKCLVQGCLGRQQRLQQQGRLRPPRRRQRPLPCLALTRRRPALKATEKLSDPLGPMHPHAPMAALAQRQLILLAQRPLVPLFRCLLCLPRCSKSRP